MRKDASVRELPTGERMRIVKYRYMPVGLSEAEVSCLPRACIVTGMHGDELEGQYVVYELVERNLHHLLIHAPQMPAPAVSLPAAAPAPDSDAFRLEAETMGQYLHIYGLFDPAYADADAAYVTIGGQTYQAFLCCEQEALELDTHQANGFSCYLPAELAADTVQITIQTKDGCVQYSGTIAV